MTHRNSLMIALILTVMAWPALAVDKHPAHHQSMTHAHGPIEVVQKDKAPSVKLKIVKDHKGEWDVEVQTINFTFVPSKVNTDPVQGEGHAHLYVDGKKQRLYCPYVHLDKLSSGKHTLRVTLNANDHSEFSLNGKIIEDTLVIEQ